MLLYKKLLLMTFGTTYVISGVTVAHQQCETFYWCYAN